MSRQADKRAAEFVSFPSSGLLCHLSLGFYQRHVTAGEGNVEVEKRI